MADEVIKYQFETNAEEVAQSVGKLEKEFKGLDATFEDVYGDIKPLTGRLGEIEDRMYQLAQAGDTASAEFRELSKEASRLKNVQKEVDLQLDRTSRTMSEKFNSGVNLVTGSMVLAEGAMSALGVSADDSEELMSNMFTTLATGQALLQIEEVTGWFSGLAKGVMKSTIAVRIATAAQWMWNAAMAANPVGLIVAGIAALVTGIIALTSWMSANTEEAEANAKATRDVAAANEELEQAMNRIGGEYGRAKKQREADQKHRLAMAKTNGATAKELQDIEEKNRKDNLAATNAAYREANMMANDDAGNKAKLLTKLLAEREAYEAQELSIKNKYILLAAQAKAAATQKDADAKKTQQEKDKSEKAASDAVEAQKKADAAAAELVRLQQFLLDEAEVIEDSRQRRMEGDRYEYFEAKRTEDTRYEQSLTDLKKSLDLGLITQAEYDARVESAKILHTANLKKIETTETTRKESARMGELAKELNDMDTSFERKKEILLEQRAWILANTAEGSAERFELLNANAKSEADLDQEAFQRKLDNAAKISQMTGSLISSIQTMQQAQFDEDNKNGKQDEKSKEKRAKKQFEAQKKLNIAMAVVNASQAIISSLAQSPVSIAGAPSPLGIASLAVATASGIASIAAIRKTTFQGSGSGGAPTTPSFNPQSPTFNTVGQSAATTDDVANGAQAQIDGASDRPTRAYVVSTDITSQQALDRATESQGELG